MAGVQLSAAADFGPLAGILGFTFHAAGRSRCCGPLDDLMNGSRRDGVGSCAQCRAKFDYMIIHNGFNDTAYAYCDRCGMTALVGGWNDTNKPSDAPLRIHEPIQEETEPWLETCTCSGHFRRDSAPRCPGCGEALSAELATKWIEKNAPGTKVGWRWQRTWTGMYCIVVDGRMVENNWRSRPKVA